MKNADTQLLFIIMTKWIGVRVTMGFSAASKYLYNTFGQIEGSRK